MWRACCAHYRARAPHKRGHEGTAGATPQLGREAEGCERRCDRSATYPRPRLVAKRPTAGRGGVGTTSRGGLLERLLGPSRLVHLVAVHSSPPPAVLRTRHVHSVPRGRSPFYNDNVILCPGTPGAAAACAAAVRGRTGRTAATA